MRAYVRIAFLLVAAALLVGAIQVRKTSDDPAVHDYPAFELRALKGETGQRQAIEFRVDDQGRPRSFATELYNHCPDRKEWRVRWSPGDGAPVPFRVQGERLTVHEEGDTTYDRGRTGSGTVTMEARLTGDRIEGRIRSVWRFARDGKEYAVCDTGYVPFAAGEGARARLARMSPSGEPWSLYPEAPAITAPRSVEGFSKQVDAACYWTYHRLKVWRRNVAQAVGSGPHRAKILRRQYLRGHIAQLRALLRLGSPPAARATYNRWLSNFSERLHLERAEVVALERGNLDAAGRLAAQLALMKARGNVAGLRFGLKTCTSNGPTGAANVG